MSNSPERSFFKLMLTPALRFNKLSIPKDFASQYYEELDAYCYLEVPTGVTHRVKLDEEDDELWFGNGLKEFIDTFSIRFGYFLLFIYQGDSQFLVHIYDLTTCEISYKRRRDSPSLESCEEFESHVSISSPGSDLQDEMLNSESWSECSNGSMIWSFSTFPYSKYPWLIQFRYELDVLANARIPVPNNPFFVTSIRKYNLDGCSLIIPFSFDREYLRCQSGDFVRVKVDDGRQWSIQCCRHRKRCILCHGLNRLVQEMHLDIGDICLFELTDVERSVFRLFVLEGS